MCIVKTAIKHGKDELTVDMVVKAFRYRDIELKSKSKMKSFSVRGRPANWTWI